MNKESNDGMRTFSVCIGDKIIRVCATSFAFEHGALIFTTDGKINAMFRTYEYVVDYAMQVPDNP